MIKYVSPLSPPHGHTCSCHPTLSKGNVQRDNSQGRLDRYWEHRKGERERDRHGESEGKEHWGLGKKEGGEDEMGKRGREGKMERQRASDRDRERGGKDR